MQRVRSLVGPLLKLNHSRSILTCKVQNHSTLPSKITCSQLSFCKARKTVGNLQIGTQKFKMSGKADEPLVALHDEKAKKFYIKLGDAEAVLEYTKRGDVWNLWHTEVPPALQGKGIAKILAKEAFDHIVKNNLKMKLTCTYLQKYYLENPKDEYKKHVVS